MTDDRRRAIGKVVSVSADRFVVELHRGNDNFTVVGFDDIHYVARIGAFTIIPVQSEYVVAEVVGLWEKDPTAMKAGSDVANESDKSISAKYLELIPVGMLPQKRDGAFKFGVSLFPSLYADALYTTDDELDRIFEVAGAEEKVPPPPDGNGDGSATWLYALGIGDSVVFHGYEVKVRVDEYFGGHVAVLGNTGSGKSCTVATILQSLFEKKNEFIARGSTFIVLDVNGEYRQAFMKIPSKIKRLYLQVLDNPVDNPATRLDESESTRVFRLPHWFMSVEEWELLLRASERTQQPVLRTALGLTTLFSERNGERLPEIRNHILASCLQHIIRGEGGSPTKHDRIVGLLSTFSTDEINMDSVREKIKIDFGRMEDVESLTKLLEGYIQENISLPGYDHCEFEFSHLGDALDLALLYEEAHGNKQIRDYCAQMITRFKWINERDEFAFLRVSPSDPDSR